MPRVPGQSHLRMILQTPPPTAAPAPSETAEILEKVVETSADAVPMPDAAVLEAVERVPAAWEQWLAWGVVPVAFVLVLVLWRSGALSARGLERSPNRRVGLSAWDALIGLWLWFCGGLMAGGFLGGLASSGGGSSDTSAGAYHPGLVIVSQVLAFGPPVAWLLWRCASPRGKASAMRRLGLVPRRPGRELGWVLIALPVGLLLSMAAQVFFTALATWWGDPPPPIQHDLLVEYAAMKDDGQWGRIALLTVSTVVLAPLTEELFNRGLLQTSLLAWWGRRHRWAVIGSVSVFFALLHAGAVPWVALPALALLGVVFGFLYERTGSLWPPMMVHAGFNALNVAYVLGTA